MQPATNKHIAPVGGPIFFPRFFQENTEEPRFLISSSPYGRGRGRKKARNPQKENKPDPRPDHAPARRFGVTRAAVSKRIIGYCEKLGLPEARGMKKAEARDTYRERQRKVARGRHRPNGAFRNAKHFFQGQAHEQRN